MIRTKTAQNIAASWHGGQWSALYQFASSGVFVIENHLRYLQEVESCLHPEYALYPGELTKGQERELTNLKWFFVNTGFGMGINTEYHKHNVYGYEIPYISENTPDRIANQVKQISYMK
jgi:hypothetical protein